MNRQIRNAFPILSWLPQYETQWFRFDFIAGITLAAYAIPVSLAYASLAGLPSQSGLYCYLLGCLAYAVFGTSRQLAIGPTSAISILIGGTLAGVAGDSGTSQLHLAMATGVLAGFIGVLAWVFRLGSLVNFVSETVLTGFKVGAGLVIASTQLPKLFGVSSAGDNFFTRVIDVVRHLSEINWPTFAIGCGALVLLYLGERFLPGLPVALVVMVLAIVLMTFTSISAYGVKTIGLIPPGLPHLGWPLVHWSEADNLLPLALACFLLSYVESISTARTFALKYGYEINADQELLALGAANLAAGLGQAYPLAGGMSQSAVNEKSGAKTPLSLVFASVTIGIVLLFLTGLMKNLPSPVLAAVVLMAVKGLINPSELRHLNRVSKFEFRVGMVAMAGVLCFGILKGVLLAAVFSLVVLLRRASRPRVLTLGRLPGTDRFVDAARYPENLPVPDAVILRVESGLFYFNVQNVKAEILGQLERRDSTRRTRLVIIDFSTSANIDVAGVRMLRELKIQLRRLDIDLKLAEVHGEVRDLMHAEGLQDIEGTERRLGIASFVDQAR
jgi:high affinity sulfate transporter 1